MAEVREGSILISSESNEPVTSDNGTILCEPCSEDGNNNPGYGYCVDCDEHLCYNCYQHHCRPRPFRNHVLQLGTNTMTQGSRPKMSDAGAFKCQLHPNKAISSYCKSHDQLCCETCILIGHRSCNYVRKIQALGADIADDEEFKTFAQKLEKLNEKCGENKSTAVVNQNLIETCYSEAMDGIKRKLDKLKADDGNKLSSIVNTCDTVQKQLGEWKADKDKFSKDHRGDQLFVLMKLAQKQLDMTEANVEQLTKGNKIMLYRFTEDKDNENTTIGKLVKTSYLLKKINVKHSSETKTCSLRDIALLQDDNILVTDYNNCSIKLINTSTNTIMSYTELSEFPHEITVTDNNQVYVAQPHASKLLHLTTPTVDVSNIREIPVDGKCFTVKYHNNKLKLQYYDPCKQVETDLNGRKLRTIYKDISKAKTEKGETFVTCPWFSVLNKKTGSMFVSCLDKYSITEISDSGNVKLLVKSDKLQSPRGIVMDTDDSILVCSAGGECVFRVTGTGEIQDNVLPEQLEFNPIALAMDMTTRKLYVGGYDYDSVLVFQL